jgi:leukotriene-A4 hydrolase
VSWLASVRTQEKLEQCKKELKTLISIRSFVTKLTKMIDSDPNSYSNINRIAQKHFLFNLTVDLDKQTIQGKITIRFEILKPCRSVVLDTKNLIIRGVQELQGNQWTESSYRLLSGKAVYGQPLEIYLSTEMGNPGETVLLEIDYETTPNSSAIQWLNQSIPFCFTQSQAIHARSFFPCQDTPSAKVTYSAEIELKSSSFDLQKVQLLMSAIKTNADYYLDEEKKVKFSQFEQSVAISPYLVAMVCGELESIRIGNRCTIWCEPSQKFPVAKEFEDLEKYLDVCETFCGPYIFNTFDMVVLPSSFPYGGMENPNLVYVTPTLIAGDKSQVHVVIHEIIHSWSGNSITCSNWEHFFINEGLTVYLESKILAEIFGQEISDLHSYECWISLKRTISDFQSVGSSNFTKLVIDLKSIDPDDAFSCVPYHKGAAFFHKIESIIGPRMLRKIKELFRAYQAKNITAQQLKEFLKDGEPALSKFDFNSWFSNAGMPLDEPKIDKSYVEDALKLAGNIVSGEEKIKLIENFGNWPSSKKVIFIQGLTDSMEKLTEIDGVFQRLTELNITSKMMETNFEVKTAFLTFALKNKQSQFIEEAKSLAISQGRMKFTRPIYKALRECWGLQETQTFFQSNIANYHPICAKMVAKDLQIDL